MTEDERERLARIRRANQRERENRAPEIFDDIDFLLSLCDSQAAVGIPDDLPYRIVEEMGLGLTFRSCACGQLPCARLRPLRDALEAIATRMRCACVEKLSQVRENHLISNNEHYEKGFNAALKCAEIAMRLVTPEQLEQESLNGN